MRSVGNLAIQFGLLSVAVKLYTAASAKTTAMKMVTPKGNFVKQKYFDAVTDEEVTYASCNKGVEGPEGKPIVLTKEEVKSLESEKSDLQIQKFVPESEVADLLVEKTYYLGPNKGSDKAYSLLAKTLKGKKRAAVIQYSSHGRDHLVVIRPYKSGLVMDQLYYANEVADFDEIEMAKIEASDAEVEMAGQLVDMLSKPQMNLADFKEGYSERLKEALQKKIDGTSSEGQAVEKKEEATILSLLDALKASIQAGVKAG